MEYKSSVLRCNVEDPDCAVCRFLNGSSELPTTDMLEVIRVLDHELARAEGINYQLTREYEKIPSERGPH